MEPVHVFVGRPPSRILLVEQEPDPDGVDALEVFGGIQRREQWRPRRPVAGEHDGGGCGTISKQSHFRSHFDQAITYAQIRNTEILGVGQAVEPDVWSQHGHSSHGEAFIETEPRLIQIDGHGFRIARLAGRFRPQSSYSVLRRALECPETFRGTT